MFNFKRNNNLQERDTDPINQISKYGVIKPNYKQDLSNRRVVEFIYLNDEQVLLIGSMDGHYPYWISKTNTSDIETNSKILHRILFDDFNAFTEFSPGFNKRMRSFYSRSIYLRDGMIMTPSEFGFTLNAIPIANWGKYLAEAIYKHNLQTIELCKYREMDGKYLEILEGYLDFLQNNTSSDPVRNYEEKLSLKKIIESEDYLFRSKNSKIFNVYLQIRDIMKYMYDRYMDIVR